MMNSAKTTPSSSASTSLLDSAVPNEHQPRESALRNAFEGFNSVIDHFSHLLYFFDAYPECRLEWLSALAGDYSLERLAEKLTRLQECAQKANIPFAELDERLRPVTDIAGSVAHPNMAAMDHDPRISDELRYRLNALMRLRDYYCLSAARTNPKDAQPIAELSETLKKLDRPFAQISDLGKELVKAATVDGLTDLGKELADAAKVAVPTDLFKELVDAAEAGKLHGPSMVQKRIDQILATQDRAARASRDAQETAPPLAPKSPAAAKLPLPDSLQGLIPWLAERTLWFNNYLLDSSADLPAKYIEEIQFLHGCGMEDARCLQQWAKELQSYHVRWLLTAVHAKLAELGLFGYPNWTLDYERDFPKYSAEASRHLCNLLNFLRSQPNASGDEKPRANKKPGKGESKRERGRPRDTNLKADNRIFDAWQTNRYRTYAELAKELGLPEAEVRTAIDRQRKRPQATQK
jgi:hypothetical protein